MITRELSPGFGLSGKWDTFFRFRLAFDEVRSGGELFPRDRAFVTFWTSPSRALSDIRLEAVLGDEVDFAEEVYIGRATVSTAEAAAVFVDKVMAYEGIAAGSD